MQDFARSLMLIEDAVKTWQSKSNDKFSHLDKTEIDKVQKILMEKRKWYDQIGNRFNALRSHEDPAVFCSQIKQEQDVS